MEESLISFETAKLAKEKSFNLNVRSMYLEDKLYVDTNSKGNYNNVSWVRTWRSSPNDDTLSTPTQSLLQKWLREVHNIEVFAKSGYKNLVKIGFYYGGDLEYSKTIFKTYEEALEIGLQEALKLIPDGKKD